MDRYVIMVDAGYLLAKSIQLVSAKTSTQRRELDITDPAGLIAMLDNRTRTALKLAGKELLRVYWYDGVMSGGLTPQQRAISELPDVNFRGGLVNSKGQQKGVDSLIVMDLFELASNRAVTDAALVTGDSDLAIGIDLAQKKGVRIAVLGIEDLTVGVLHGQSREITDRADRVHRFGSAALSPVVKYSPTVAITISTPTATVRQNISTPSASVGAAPPAAKAAATLALTALQKAAIDSAVASFVATNNPAATAVDPGTKRIETTLDKALLFHVFTTLSHGALANTEKNHARECLRKRLGCSAT
jgi:uncharacterized LabA/DUF88 family protein